MRKDGGGVAKQHVVAAMTKRVAALVIVGDTRLLSELRLAKKYYKPLKHTQGPDRNL